MTAEGQSQSKSAIAPGGRKPAVAVSANCCRSRTVGSAPVAVVPGRIAVTRMQTFAQAWRSLFRFLLLVDMYICTFQALCTEPNYVGWRDALWSFMPTCLA
jgi:hypothetical protein